MSEDQIETLLTLLNRALGEMPSSQSCQARMETVTSRIDDLTELMHSQIEAIRQLINERTTLMAQRVQKLEATVEMKLSDGWPARTVRLEERLAGIEASHRTQTERWTRILSGIVVLTVASAAASIATAALRFLH